jgi:hypothetical protein
MASMGIWVARRAREALPYGTKAYMNTAQISDAANESQV